MGGTIICIFLDSRSTANQALLSWAQMNGSRRKKNASPGGAGVLPLLSALADFPMVASSASGGFAITNQKRVLGGLQNL